MNIIYSNYSKDYPYFTHVFYANLKVKRDIWIIINSPEWWTSPDNLNIFSILNHERALVSFSGEHVTNNVGCGWPNILHLMTLPNDKVISELHGSHKFR